MTHAEQPLVAFADLTADGFSDFDSERGVLIGSRCEDCSSVVFPQAFVCYRCRGSRLVPQDLPREGILQSFTHVRVSSTRAVPYSIGYVDLPGDVRLLAPLKTSDAIACDVAVRLVADESAWVFEAAQGGQTNA